MMTLPSFKIQITKSRGRAAALASYHTKERDCEVVEGAFGGARKEEDRLHSFTFQPQERRRHPSHSIDAKNTPPHIIAKVHPSSI